MRVPLSRVGSAATGTQVTLAEAELSARDGRGELRELVVGNPEGVEPAHAIRFGTVRVVLDTSTVGSRPVVVKEVVIEEPQVTLEVGRGGTNLGTIRDNVDAFSRRMGGGGEPGGGEGPPSEGGGPAGDEGARIVIESLIVRRGRVAVSATILGGGEVGTELGEIHLRDIGRGEGGATPAEIAAEVLRAVTAGAIRDAGRLEIEGLDLKALAEDALERGRNAVRDAAGEVGKRLGGLLGR